MRLLWPIVITAFAFSGCKDGQKSDSSSEESDAEGEGVSPPENIAGTYLVCSATSEPTPEAPAAVTKCMLANGQNGKKINMSKLATKAQWTTSAAAESADIISFRELQKDPKGHVEYTFKGKTPEESLRAMRETYIEITYTSLTKNENVVLGAPLASIRTTNFLHGDIDGDGFVDLIDRHTDGSVSLYFFDASQKPEFPFREEKQTELAWHFSNYFVGNFRVAGTRNMIVARNFAGTFNYMEYKPTGNKPNRGPWFDPGPMPDQMTDFTASVVGAFTGNNESIITRSVNNTLSHYFIGSPGQKIDGTWNSDLIVACDCDGDGLTDLVTVASDGTGKYHRNITPTNTYSPKFDVPTPLSFNFTGVTNLIAADFTGEKKQSLIARTSKGELVLLKTGIEGSNIVWSTSTIGGDGWTYDDYFSMDVDKDGKFEFVARNADNKLRSTELP
ncbi:MAG: hypothetical protein AB7T49_08005 [Oligoflexales bacterium]